MSCYVLDLQHIDRTQVALVGGKGAHLGELSRIEGVRVPAGLCVTTDAFRRVMASPMDAHIERLSQLEPNDREGICALSAQIRSVIEQIRIPADLATAIASALEPNTAYAVRSSATAEDLPELSFAGQQDSYLNIVGAAAVLQHISRCWASLFTERAVTYRLRNRLDHHKVHMAVVVQQMVLPQAAGILFTADPLTGNRKIVSVEASFGLGEAVVAGLVTPDVYKVRGAQIVAKAIATKPIAIHATPAGGTQQRTIDSQRQQQPALTEPQVLQLAQLGRRIEAHFGCPQDIEWCLTEGEFDVVQSRPITTLFPIPAAADLENHVYISVGHQQMMTDAMKPLGLSVWQLMTQRPMAEAGGRLFVDVTRMLAAPSSRANLMKLLGRSDPLIGDALQNLLERGDFVPSLPDERAPAVIGSTPATIATDPAIPAMLIASNQASLAALKRDIQGLSGVELFDFILASLQQLKRILFDPQSLQVIMAGMEATWWLNEQLQAWLGEKNAADTLTQSVPNNVTSEMGLALLDVADVIRPYPGVIKFLQHVDNEDFLDELPKLAGGRAARDAIQGWLDKYGVRGVGEIDITRPRWSECPSLLVPMILGNLAACQSGAAKQRFEQGLREAHSKEQNLLERLRELPDGEHKAAEVKRMIERVRTFAGYREYPKYGWVSHYFVYKQALLAEAERLVQARVLREKEDIFYLRFQELHEVVRTHQVDAQLIEQRKATFLSYRALTPPRVLTSDGEAVTGAYRREGLPAGSLAGLPVSTGTVEGRARVLLDPAQAKLEAGDILVTAYTDPSWTPLFVAVKGLVTEVGGLMTHGAVIAREYGLPAVVGVERATRLIKDGQRIRVHGTDGYVEILSSSSLG